jgi:uncharacterized membrane protein YphA (DoxX/SURF4 family)
VQLLVLIAEVYLETYFLYNSYNHFANRAAVAGFAQMRGAPALQLLWIITGVMYLAAGVSLLSGYKGVVGAWLAIIFLVLAAFLVHHFWTDQGMDRVGQQVNFNKNLALAAALPLVTLAPANAWVISIGR